jgi:hypothetical protein
MSGKNLEYSRNEDKLHNFKVASRVLGCTPEYALLGMATKHFVSVLDIVNDINNHNRLPSEGVLIEKITDSINYLVLLEALIRERNDNETIKGEGDDR